MALPPDEDPTVPEPRAGIEYRVREDDNDAVREDGQVAVSEQALVAEVQAVVDALYYRVTERSPSTLNPWIGLGGEILHRVTEQWWRPSEPDYRILQRQLIAGATLVASATLRSHVGELHYLLGSRARIDCIASRRRVAFAASRAGIRLAARSDFRKTRAM